MATRPVTHTRKDRYGTITGLGNPGSNGYGWSVRTVADCIRDIESGAHTYYVPWQSGSTWIRVVNGSRGKYLRTDRDDTARNNLDDLPEI